jgi:WD40 repeat protein
VDAGGRLRVWDVASGELTHAVDAHVGGATRAAFSPDGRLLATTGADGAVRLWAVRQQIAGRALRVQPAGGLTTCLALSPDGRLAASGHMDRVVELFDVSTGRLLRSWTLQWPVASLAVTQDGSTLRAATSQSSVFTLALAGPKLVPNPLLQESPRPLTRPAKPDRLNPGNNAFSHDGMRSVHYSIGGAALWDVAAGRLTRVLDPRPAEAACFVPPTGRAGGGAVDVVVAIVDRGSELVAFNVAGDTIRRIALRAGGRITAMAASPDAHVVVVGDDVGQIRSLDMVTWQWAWTLRAHSGAVTCLAFAPDGRTILSGGVDGALRLADAAVGRTLHVVGRGQAAVRGALFSPDGRRLLAAVGDGRTTRSWELSLAEEFRHNAKSALMIAGRADDPSLAEKLRLAEWFLLEGQPDWARGVLAKQAPPRALDAAMRATLARDLWAAGDAATASRHFATVLEEHPASKDQMYLTLCRDAAAGGEP